MRRSKLEMYVDILKVLAQRGPLKLTHVMYKANVNCSVLKEYLEFLIKQNLVEERTIGKRRVVYVVTQRGITVLKYFRELKQVLPIVEESRNFMPIPFWSQYINQDIFFFFFNFLMIIGNILYSSFMIMLIIWSLFRFNLGPK